MAAISVKGGPGGNVFVIKDFAARQLLEGAIENRWSEVKTDDGYFSWHPNACGIRWTGDVPYSGKVRVYCMRLLAIS